MSYALALTASRIFLSPLLPLLYLNYASWGLSLGQMALILFILLALCESSDVLDGQVARRRNEVTDLGKLLDPMADSLLHLPLFLAFTQGVVQLPLWLVLIFVYRELLISALRSFCALRGVALAARPLGKGKTVSQALSAFAIVLLIFFVDQGQISVAFLRETSVWLTVIAVVYAVCSAMDYVWANRLRLWREA